MIRNANYSSFRGKEYRIVREDDHYDLISNEKIDLGNGFELCKNRIIRTVSGKLFEAAYDEKDPPIYIKILTPSEVREVYSINTFGIYRGRKFPILEETDNQYMLGADDFIFDPETAKKFGFDMYLRGEYHKWVDKSEVEHVYEIKKPLPDFVR